MLALFLLFLPFIIIIIEGLLVGPLVLYFIGKLLKIDNPAFKFTACIWMNFVASLVAGFTNGINIFLSLALYVLLLGYFLKKQFGVTTKNLVIMIATMLIVTGAINYLQTFLILRAFISSTPGITTSTINGVGVLPSQEMTQQPLATQTTSNQQKSSVCNEGTYDERTSVCVCPVANPSGDNMDGIVYCSPNYGSSNDSQKKADLNTILDVIETYHLTALQYPQESACVENLSELNQYFVNNTVPSDPEGTQDFKVAQCKSGYYYLYIPDHGYTLWAKMDSARDGSINDTPDVYKDEIISRISLAIGGGGTYYMADPTNFLAQQTPIAHGVQRIKVKSE